jgi:nucleotide-binding universal stress UspA family protein
VTSIESVLMAVDFTPATDGVVHRGLQLAASGLRRARVVHVIDSRVLDGIAGLGIMLRTELEAAARTAAEASLAALAARLRHAGVARVDVECRCGRPDTEILAAIGADAPSLVLAGAGNRMWRQVVLGSTVRRLLRGVGRPLWLVRNDGDTRIEHVLMASDLGPAAAAAAHLAASEWPHAEFELLYVAEHVADVAAGLAEKAAQVAAISSELQQRCHARMEAFAAENLRDRKVVMRLEHGHPVGVVLRRIRELKPDLLVMGRSGKRGVDALVLGSVAEALIEMVECDLLLVPAPIG